MFEYMKTNQPQPENYRQRRRKRGEARFVDRREAARRVGKDSKMDRGELLKGEIQRRWDGGANDVIGSAHASSPRGDKKQEQRSIDLSSRGRYAGVPIFPGGGTANIVQRYEFNWSVGTSRYPKDVKVTINDEYDIERFLAAKSAAGRPSAEMIKQVQQKIYTEDNEELAEQWNNVRQQFDLETTKEIKLAEDKDEKVFEEIEKIRDAGKFGRHREAIDYLNQVIKAEDRGKAGALHKLISSSEKKKRSLTEAVRPGLKHEHLMTSMSIDRINSDLKEISEGERKRAFSEGIIGGTKVGAWDLLNETLSDTKQIVLRTTTDRGIDKKTQDHHVTSNDNIYFLQGTKKIQATGQGSGNGLYHQDLKSTISDGEDDPPKVLAEELRGVNDDWLATEKSINDTEASDRGQQFYKADGVFKRFDNKDQLKIIAKKVDSERKNVLSKFDRFHEKLK